VEVTFPVRTWRLLLERKGVVIFPSKQGEKVSEKKSRREKMALHKKGETDRTRMWLGRVTGPYTGGSHADGLGKVEKKDVQKKND